MDIGRADDLVVEHDGKAVADVVGGDLAEAATAGGVEAETDDRHTILERGLRVDQALAGDFDAAADDIGLVSGFAGTRQKQRARRQVARIGANGARLHQMEIELRRLADQVLDSLGIIDARQFDDDAFPALQLDRRLTGAELVDAATHNLKRLADGGKLAFTLNLFRDRDLDAVFGKVLKLHAVGDLQDLGARGRAIRCIDQRYRHGVIGRTQAAGRDFLIAQTIADGFLQIRELFLHDRRRIDFKQQI